MGYERFSLRLEDYKNADQFLPILKEEIAKRSKLLAQAARYNLESCCGCDEIFDLYLYQLQIEDDNTTVTELEVPETYSITVTEDGGNGSYYVLNGNYRKANHNVEIMIIPPTGYGAYIEVNGDTIPVAMTTAFIHLFVMPEEDVDVIIHYVSEGAGTAWKMGWFGKDVCVTKTIADALVTFTVKWDCDHPIYDLSCPQCTSAITKYEVTWQREVCASPGVITFTLKWEDDLCYSTSTLYKMIWQEILCAAPGVITFEMEWRDEMCNAPVVDGGKVWQVQWSNQTCEGLERTFSVYFEADDQYCVSAEEDDEYFVMYPGIDGSSNVGYIASGTQGALDDTTMGTDTITNWYATPAGLFLLDFGGAQHDAKTELKVRIGPYVEVLMVWNAGTTQYECTSTSILDYFEDVQAKGAPMTLRIDPNGFDANSGNLVVDSFSGTNVVLDDAAVIIDNYVAPICFKVVGGADDGKTFVADTIGGVSGEYSQLNTNDVITQAGVTHVICYKRFES